MRSFKIKYISNISMALFWIKEDGNEFWQPVNCNGETTADSKYTDKDILRCLFRGLLLVNDEKLPFETVVQKWL